MIFHAEYFSNRRNFDMALQEKSLRERLYIFKSELTEEETRKLTKLCQSTQDRLQCLHVDSDNTDPRAAQQLAKQVTNIFPQNVIKSVSTVYKINNRSVFFKLGVTSGSDLQIRLTKKDSKSPKPLKFKPEEEPLELSTQKWDEFIGNSFLGKCSIFKSI